MRIEITRSGGFGGLTRTWSVEVSRSEVEQRWLPLAEAQAVSAEGGAPVAVSDTSSQLRDRFTYRIAIGYTEVYVSEEHLDDPWRELIERARKAAPVASDSAPQPAEPDVRGTSDDGPGEPPKLL